MQRELWMKGSRTLSGTSSQHLSLPASAPTSIESHKVMIWGSLGLGIIQR